MENELNQILNIDPDSLRVRNYECTHREFKISFDQKLFAKYAKTIAAMANSDGGRIFFGISDKPHKLVGIDEDKVLDVADITTKLNNLFEPSIRIYPSLMSYNDKITIFMIKIDKSPNRPVICKKNQTIQITKKNNTVDETIISAGAIYYRYSGKSSLIEYSELISIFEERDKKIFDSITQNIRQIQKIGFDRVGVLDIKKLGSEQTNTKVFLSKEAAEDLRNTEKDKFIEYGSGQEQSPYIHSSILLQSVAEVPVDDDDRIKPGKVCEQLKQDIEQYIYPDFNLVPNHLLSFAVKYGYRQYKEIMSFDNKYCKYDSQAEQWFYREAFVSSFRKELRRNPKEILSIISSKKNVEKYEKRHKK